MYTYCEVPAAREAALALCRGRYQRWLIQGHAAWSGADLRGKARTYSARYAESRRNLLRRLSAAGIPHHEARDGRRSVVILGIW